MIPSPACDGLGAGGEVRRPLPLKLLWLALCALASQILVILLVPDPAIRIAFPATCVAIFPFLIANWRFVGIKVMTAGVLLNFLVIAANGGLMPVDAAAVDAVGEVDSSSLSAGNHIPGTKNILLAPEDTRLRPLGDTILITLPYSLTTRAVSPGDLLLALGLTVAGVEILRNRHPNLSAAEAVMS